MVTKLIVTYATKVPTFEAQVYPEINLTTNILTTLGKGVKPVDPCGLDIG